MSERVYLVECDKGHYTDGVSWVVGVFTNPIDAENYRVQIEDRMKWINDNAPAISFDNNDFSYWEYYGKPENKDAYEWNCARIIEFELNKKYL